MSTPRSKDKGGIFCSCFGNSKEKVSKAKNNSFLEPPKENKSVTLDKKDDQKKALELDKPDFNIKKI